MKLALSIILLVLGAPSFVRRCIVILAFGGVVTAVPLLWFGKAAERIPLSTMGFIQYLSPSMQLLLGVMVFGEPFTTSHVVCFSCIWVGLILFSVDAVVRNRKSGT